MVPENNSDDHDKYERLATPEEMIYGYFSKILDALNNKLGIEVTAKKIADFCKKEDLRSPKLFTFAVLHIIIKTLHEKLQFPKVRYFRIPSWLDVKAQEVSKNCTSAEDLKKLLPNLPEGNIKSDRYEQLAYEFLQDLI